MSIKKLATWLALPAFLFSAVAQAQDAPLNKAEVEKTIRAYLLEHPEILMEMSQALQARQSAAKREKAQTALAANREALAADVTSPVAGVTKVASDTVTIVEFFDYRCGYCKRVDPTLDKLMAEDPKIRVVYKEFPILGPESMTASLAALAADKQGAYPKFHRALMSTNDYGTDALRKLATDAGLDAEKLFKDMASPELVAAITRNQNLAEKLGVEATPAFVIGNEMVPGAIDEATFRQMIAKARAEATLKAGN